MEERQDRYVQDRLLCIFTMVLALLTNTKYRCQEYHDQPTHAGLIASPRQGYATDVNNQHYNKPTIMDFKAV